MSQPDESKRALYPASERRDPIRYTSRAFHDREVDGLWRRCWQIACLSSEVATPGSYVEYTIVDESILIVRGEDGILRAMSNVCRHRGTLLRHGSGALAEIRCPFHGWRYALDGNLEEIVNAWDFPDVDRSACRLPQFGVGEWAGFVFVNLDPDAEPLETFLGPLTERFEGLFMERRYRSLGMSTVLPCNWKIALAAFPETYHVPWTHPTIAFYTSDVGSEFELLGEHGWLRIPRQSSPNNTAPLEDDEFLDEYLALAPDLDHDLARSELARGRSAREVLTTLFRRSLERMGVPTEGVPDERIVDAEGFLVFPNVVAYAGLTSHGITWRFRPNGNDPGSCIVDLWLLTFAPDPDAVPEDAPVQHYPEGTRFSEVLGPANRLGAVFDQDLSNLATVQRAFRSPTFEGPLYGRYQEALIRNFEDALDRRLARLDAAPSGQSSMA